MHLSESQKTHAMATGEFVIVACRLCVASFGLQACDCGQAGWQTKFQVSAIKKYSIFGYL